MMLFIIFYQFLLVILLFFNDIKVVASDKHSEELSREQDIEKLNQQVGGGVQFLDIVRKDFGVNNVLKEDPFFFSNLPAQISYIFDDIKKLDIKIDNCLNQMLTTNISLHDLVSTYNAIQILDQEVTKGLDLLNELRHDLMREFSHNLADELTRISAARRILMAGQSNIKKDVSLINARLVNFEKNFSSAIKHIEQSIENRLSFVQATFTTIIQSKLNDFEDSVKKIVEASDIKVNSSLNDRVSKYESNFKSEIESIIKESIKTIIQPLLNDFQLKSENNLKKIAEESDIKVNLSLNDRLSEHESNFKNEIESIKKTIKSELDALKLEFEDKLKKIVEKYDIENKSINKRLEVIEGREPHLIQNVYNACTSSLHKNKIQLEGDFRIKNENSANRINKLEKYFKLAICFTGVLVLIVLYQQYCIYILQRNINSVSK